MSKTPNLGRVTQGFCVCANHNNMLMFQDDLFLVLTIDDGLKKYTKNIPITISSVSYTNVTCEGLMRQARHASPDSLAERPRFGITCFYWVLELNRADVRQKTLVLWFFAVFFCV